MWTPIRLAVVALFLGAGMASAADPLAREDLDKRLRKVAYDAAVAGSEIFNSGNQDGCYRLYEGTLNALLPLFDHRPELAKTIKDKLDSAKATPRSSDKAFVLREAIDEVMKQIDGPAKPMGKKTLWERLGGEPAVKAVVHEFVIVAAPDPKVNFLRDGKYKLDAAGVVALEQQLVNMISSATGGPLKYTGKNMKDAHKGMGITDAEFDALAGHLVATLKKFKVPTAEMDELVGIVASTKKDIVEPAAPKPPVPPVKKVLWDRLGGEKAVKAVVHDFVALTAANPKVNFTRGGKYKIDAAGVEKLELSLVEMISSATGGPLKYTGKSMKDAHKGMKITEAEFTAIAGDLVATLKKFKVPQAEIDELVGIVASTKKDIVEVKDDE